MYHQTLRRKKQVRLVAEQADVLFLTGLKLAVIIILPQMALQLGLELLQLQKTPVKKLNYCKRF